MIIKEIKTIVKEYNSPEELDKKEQSLIQLAKESVSNAYTPYSHFNVGAAVLLENGETVSGNNQENAAYPSGLCAERVAMFYANSKYPNLKPIAIAIAAFSNGDFIEVPIPPCGSCRQVLLETESRFNSDLKIILYGSKKIYVIESAKSLLPLNFDAKFLEKKK
jgi:cytidine deaminase